MISIALPVAGTLISSQKPFSLNTWILMFEKTIWSLDACFGRARENKKKLGRSIEERSSELYSSMSSSS